MEKIALIVDRLNQPPFRKGLTTMTEFDSKSSLELLDYMCEIISNIDPDQVIAPVFEVRTDREKNAHDSNPLFKLHE